MTIGKTLKKVRESINFTQKQMVAGTSITVLLMHMWGAAGPNVNTSNGRTCSSIDWGIKLVISKKSTLALIIIAIMN